jgi:hypothetical protein
MSRLGEHGCVVAGQQPNGKAPRSKMATLEWVNFRLDEIIVFPKMAMKIYSGASFLHLTQRPPLPFHFHSPRPESHILIYRLVGAGSRVFSHPPLKAARADMRERIGVKIYMGTGQI